MANGGVAGGFLSPSAVTRLRALSRAGMTATCAVHRRTETPQAGGEPTVTWAPVTGLTALPCSVKPAGDPSETLTADAATVAERYVVRFPPTAFTDGVRAIRAEDRLVLTHAIPGIGSPMTLSVEGDLPKSVYEVARRVLATRDRAGGV